MRTAALSIAVLLGIATLAAEAHATPTVSATITIEQGKVLVTGQRGWRHHGFHRGPPHRHKGWARHDHRPDGRGRPAYAAKRFHRAPVVIVRPSARFDHRGFHHRYWPSRPPIRQGFAKRSYHW